MNTNGATTMTPEARARIEDLGLRLFKEIIRYVKEQQTARDGVTATEVVAALGLAKGVFLEAVTESSLGE